MRLIKRLIYLYPIIRAIWRLEGTDLWWASQRAVKSVVSDHKLNGVATTDPKTSFCPRCGQLPDGDRRFEEARERTISQLPTPPKRAELDCSIALNYFLHKQGS
jgi:hypothetical protein